MPQSEEAQSDRQEPTSATEASPPTQPGSALGLWIGLIVLLIPLIVYIYCLCPTIFVGDAGDFITAAYTLGIPHPPGYPVYTLLGYVFTHLPIPGGISAPAYRMNMMSALAAWGACVFLFLFLRRALRTEWAALIGALALAFSRQFWEHAEISEVYTLQIFFLTLILYLAVLYVQEKKIGWALLMAFVMGLAMSHQYAVLLFYPGVLIFIGMNGGLRLRWTTWVAAVLLAILGLVPYAYLPLVKYKTPLGEVVFVDSEEEAAPIAMDKVPIKDNPYVYFFDYFTRRAYSKSREFSHSMAALPERTTTPMVLRRTLQTTEEDFSIPLVLFGIFGWLAVIASLTRRRKKAEPGEPLIPAGAFVPPALGYILYFLVVHFYPSGDILAAPIENLEVVAPPLLIPLEAALAALIALGFDAACRWIAFYVRSQGISDLASSQKFRTFSGLLVIAAFMLVAVNAWRNAEYGDKSQSVISYNYALNVLDSCDPDAILLTTGDETFLYWYVQACDRSRDPNDPLPGYRKDVWATNWIHNLPTLEVLTDEPHAMQIVTERFLASSTYYRPYLRTFGVMEIIPDYGPRPINTTFISSSFAESRFILGLDVILQGLTYSFRLPGDVPDPADPKISLNVDLSRIEEGAAPMLVIDYFDSRPFDNYRWEGLPQFEGVLSDFSNLATAVYRHVNLEAQEIEVLGRYQDSLYRFGIQALLEDNAESAEQAVRYVFRCVSLDPDGWFGWKELGDAFFATNRLDSAEGAYRQLIEISAITGEVEPELEAGAHAQLGHIALIRGELEQAEREASLALVLDRDNKLARAVLDEVDKRLSSAAPESQAQPVEPEPSQPSAGGALEEFTGPGTPDTSVNPPSSDD